jgi:hypothetical protein
MDTGSRMFRTLPGFRRSPPGLEWRVLRALPLVLAAGIAAALAFAVSAHVVIGAEDGKLIEIAYAYAAGAALFHVTLVSTVALACFIVYVMKGPAYVADAYELPDADAPVTRVMPRAAED